MRYLQTFATAIQNPLNINISPILGYSPRLAPPSMYGFYQSVRWNSNQIWFLTVSVRVHLNWNFDFIKKVFDLVKGIIIRKVALYLLEKRSLLLILSH